MTDELTKKAWDRNEWPEWLEKIVGEANTAFSDCTEEAIAYGVFLARRDAFEQAANRLDDAMTINGARKVIRDLADNPAPERDPTNPFAPMEKPGWTEPKPAPFDAERIREDERDRLLAKADAIKGSVEKVVGPWLMAYAGAMSPKLRAALRKQEAGE